MTTCQLTPERLKEVLHYDPETGIFVWRIRPTKNKKIGDRAGCIRKPQGYRTVNVDKEQFLEHRLAWFYMTGHWPVDQIDHINGIKDDNRFCNLREASNTTNAENLHGAKKHNKLGILGVQENSNRYSARITVNGKNIYLGRFHTAEEAQAVYLEAKRKYHVKGTI